jgi:rare lipoprotein A
VAGQTCRGRWAKVSFYGLESCQNPKDCRTRSGERFTAKDMTAAMASPRHLGEVWRVTYNGKSVTVRINDTGGFAKYGRFMDLSKAVAKRLGFVSKGVVKACAVRVK